MKKLIALGVGALASASLVLGASPVKASPADPIVDAAFCADLAIKVNTSATARSSAQSLAEIADQNVIDKRNLLDDAIEEWVIAFGEHLLELDEAGGNPAATQAILDAAAAEVTENVGPWGQAKIDQFNARHAADLAEVVYDMNVTLQNTVCS